MSDLIRALAPALLVGVVPGFALASLVMPRWPAWWRLAAAPGLSAGMAGVLGLLFHLLHLRFAPATVLPVEGAVVAAAAVARRRAGGLRPVALGPDRWVVAAALAAGLLTSAGLVAGFHDQPVPVETDAPVHAEMARAIADSGDAEPVIPQPVDGSGFVRVRMGFEAEVALISGIGGPTAAGSMLPLVLLAVLLLPLGIALLCMQTLGSRPVAALAALFALGWAFPSIPVTYGEFPYVVDATLVAPLVVASLAALRGEQARRATVLATLMVASIWVIHGLEALTALCVGGFLLAGALRDGGRPALRRAVLLGAAAAFAAAAVWVLSRPPQVPAAVVPPSQGHGLAETSIFDLSIARFNLSTGLAWVREFGLPGNAALVLALLGAVAAVLTRRMRWAVASSLVVLVVVLDVVSGGHLRRLWLEVYPWSSGERVVGIFFWVLPPLMAYGVVAGWQAVAARADLPSLLGAARRRAAAGLALAGAAVAVVGAAGLARDLDTYTAATRDRGVVTGDDIRVLTATDAALPRGVLVLTDELDDAGQWLDAFAPGRALLTKAYLQSQPVDSRVVALSHACADPAAATAALRSVGAIYVGTARRSDATYPWNLACIRALPGVEVVVSSGPADGAAALLRIPADGVARSPDSH